jgi:nucleotide-binding universal stress UspA family protein
MTSNPQQVVVAYDFSGIGRAVVERAIALATRAPEHVLHFVVAIDRRSGIPAIPPVDGVDHRYAELVQTKLVEMLREMYRASTELHVFVHVRFGKPADEILQLASEVGADLIMVGSHGFTGLERLILGSTAERVAREARCAVIVVRPKTYAEVHLLDVVDVSGAAHHPHVHALPHRYEYPDNRVILRPQDWPLY